MASLLGATQDEAHSMVSRLAPATEANEANEGPDRRHRFVAFACFCGSGDLEGQQKDSCKIPRFRPFNRFGRLAHWRAGASTRRVVPGP